MAFGEWLVGALHAHDMDQAELARDLRVGTGTVSRWVNGKVLPSAANIVDIARVFRLPPGEVLSRVTSDAPIIYPDVLNLPPNLSHGESRLVEHLAWAVRHWREEQNAARAARDESADTDVA